MINHEIGYIKKWEDIKFYNKTLKALNVIQNAGFLIIIITNQSIIARKIIKRNQLLNLNKKMTLFFKNDSKSCLNDANRFPLQPLG